MKHSCINIKSDASIGDSIITMKSLIPKLSSLNVKAAGLANYANLFDAVEFYKQCLENNIKPILGSSFTLVDSDGVAGDIILYAMNTNGYINLSKLVSISNHPSNFNIKPYLPVLSIEDNSDDLICVYSKDVDTNIVNYFSHHYKVEDVAIAPSLYIEEEDHTTHEVYMAICDKLKLDEPTIPEGGKRRSFPSNSYYIEAGEFSDVQITNNNAIVSLCDVEIDLTQLRLPHFDIGKYDSAMDCLRARLREGWKRHNVNELQKQSGEEKERYLDRMNRELKDIESANIADYFLMVQDVMDWARSQGIKVGFGRGCLTPESQIMTSKGYKNIEDVSVGDVVMNQFGEQVSVRNTSSFDIDEEIITIKEAHGHQIRSDFTIDHKILVRNKDGVEWKRADKITTSDYLCIPKINNGYFNKIPPKCVDFSQYTDKHDLIIFQNNERLIIERTPSNKQYDFSLRNISKTYGISRTSMSLVKNNRHCAIKNSRLINKMSCVLINNYNMTIDEWRDKVNEQFYNVAEITKYMPIDRDLGKFLGLFIGDGYKRGSKTHIYLGSNDSEAIEFLDGFLSKNNFRYRSFSPPNKPNLIIYDVLSHILTGYLDDIFGHVRSETKFIPDKFFNYSRDFLEGLFFGLVWSDGSVRDGRVQYDTVSEQLCRDVRYLSYMFNTPSSVNVRYPKNNTNWKTSYKIRFAASNFISKHFGFKVSNKKFFIEQEHYEQPYIFIKVRSISRSKYKGKVYDLAVSGDSPTFMTGGYIVHNSASGSLVSWLLDIQFPNPIKYDLIWERFYNLGRGRSLPDIDMDFSQQDRQKIIAYIHEKYGDSHVSNTVTFNTFGTKAAIQSSLKVFGGIDTKSQFVITKMVDFKAKSVDDALEKSSELTKVSQQHKKQFDIARKIEGLRSHKGIHASAIMVSDNVLEDEIPMVLDEKKQRLTTGYDMYTMETLGYLKLDVLGIRTLDVLKDVEDQVNK